MKSPPNQYPDDEARDRTEDFIRKTRAHARGTAKACINVGPGARPCEHAPQAT
jgi:hypothetical protein